MEAISHVNRHVGSSQLFECLGIQNQEECPFILERRSEPQEFIVRIMAATVHERHEREVRALKLLRWF